MMRRDFRGAGGSGTGGCGEPAARASKSFSILSPAMAPSELHLHRSHDGARRAGLSPKNSSGGSVSKEVSAREVSARKWVKEYLLLPLPTDHDNFGLNSTKIMNVIDPRNFEGMRVENRFPLLLIPH